MAESRSCSADCLPPPSSVGMNRRRQPPLLAESGLAILPVNLGGTTGMFGALVPFGMRAPFVFLKEEI